MPQLDGWPAEILSWLAQDVSVPRWLVLLGGVSIFAIVVFILALVSVPRDGGNGYQLSDRSLPDRLEDMKRKLEKGGGKHDAE